MKDQYDKEVPTDLVLLDNHWLVELGERDIWELNKLDWYKPTGSLLIFVSASQAEKCIGGLVDFTGPEDCGADNRQWLKIDQVLHRWDLNRFYHA